MFWYVRVDLLPRKNSSQFVISTKRREECPFFSIYAMFKYHADSKFDLNPFLKIILCNLILTVKKSKILPVPKFIN